MSDSINFTEDAKKDVFNLNCICPFICLSFCFDVFTSWCHGLICDWLLRHFLVIPTRLGIITYRKFICKIRDIFASVTVIYTQKQLKDI